MEKSIQIIGHCNKAREAEYNIKEENVRSEDMDNNMNQSNRNQSNRGIYCDRCFSRCMGILHIIEPGDTLYNLGRRYQVSVSDIMRANPYVNVYNLQVNDELCIPIMGSQPNFDLEEEIPEIIRIPIGDMPFNGMPMEGMPMEDMPFNGIPIESMPFNGMPMENMPMEGMQTPQEFSEEEPLNIVIEKLGITMEQFLECVYEKSNMNQNSNDNNTNNNNRNGVNRNNSNRNPK